jgi:hypothetical protein
MKLHLGRSLARWSTAEGFVEMVARATSAPPEQVSQWSQERLAQAMVAMGIWASQIGRILPAWTSSLKLCPR